MDANMMHVSISLCITCTHTLLLFTHEILPALKSNSRKLSTRWWSFCLYHTFRLPVLENIPTVGSTPAVRNKPKRCEFLQPATTLQGRRSSTCLWNTENEAHPPRPAACLSAGSLLCSHSELVMVCGQCLSTAPRAEYLRGQADVRRTPPLLSRHT